MKFQVKQVSFATLPMQTRFPFKYGIASMTELPHLMVFADLELDGSTVQGMASEGLPPKWFTKNPATTFEQDLPDVHAVIHHAADRAIEGRHEHYFAWWQQVYPAQAAWASENAIPGLLSNLGVSLMERAVLDGLCRGLNQTAYEVLRTNVLGIDLGAVHSELQGIGLDQVLSDSPSDRLHVRHTVGLGDPLTRDEEDLDDGLPLSLEVIIEETRCRYFKIKVCGDLDIDVPRLSRLAGLLPANARFTIDGNEQYRDMNHFLDHLQAWNEVEAVRGCLDRGLLFIEQPLHRDVALDQEVPREAGVPRVIIDEADADLSSLPAAFSLGYAGTSHKNCKGLVKGLANAALVKKHQGILSGEDLANVGPIALLQDCCMMSMLGIEHVERNGHHYFKGLSMWPESIQEKTLQVHGDLYREHAGGFPTLNICEGEIHIASLLNAPFGCALDPEEDFSTTVFPRADRAG